MSNPHKPFVQSRHSNPGKRRPPGELPRAVKRCLTPNGDEKCLATTQLTTPPLISIRVYVPSYSSAITPWRGKRILSAVNLGSRAGSDSLPMDPNQKEIGVKLNRASFQTLHK
jgi:hypothetical protein